MEELKLYTIGDLKQWVLKGERKEGLSDSIITPTRAFAFVNNPYVSDEMPVVSALFTNGELAAFTAAFPEKLLKPDCVTHWFNSLYVSPKYEGKGYGLFVLGSLMECYGNDPVFDLDAVSTSVEILTYLGLQSGSFDQYNFRNKSIRLNSLKGKMANVYDKTQRYFEANSTIVSLKKRITKALYTLQYDDFIDSAAFDFMREHSTSDAFLRTKDSLNWMLRYPFVHEAPLLDRVKQGNLFSSSKSWQRYYVVKVFVGSELVGVYILCDSSTRLTLLYIYYEGRYQEEVLLSITEHIIKFGNARFATTHPLVADFVQKHKLYSFNSITPTSFCYPNEYDWMAAKTIQGGDGDMLLN